MVWQGTVNPPPFGASRFDPYHLHHVFRIGSAIKLINLDCYCYAARYTLDRVVSTVPLDKRKK